MFRSDLEKVKLLCEEGKVLERKLPFLPLLEVVRADTINAPAIIDYLVLHQKVDINASTSSLERPEDWKGSIDNETALFVATSLDMHCIEDLLKYPDLEKSLKTPAICNGKIGPTPLELAKIFHNDPENKNMRRGKLYGWFIDYMEKHGIKP